MPSLINRSTVSRGPALLIFAFAGIGVFNVISEGDVTVNFALDTANQDSAAYGTLATFRTGLKPTVECKPVGVTTLFPLINAFAGFNPGRSLCGAKVANVWTDNTLIVQPLDASQQQTTFYGVAPTGLMDPQASAVAGLFDGNLTFTVAGKNNTAADAPNRLYLRAPNAGAASGYDPATLLRVSPDVHFASLLADTAGAGGNPATPNYFSTRNGAKLALGLATSDHVADGFLWDVSFKEIAPVVTLAPVGIDEDTILSAMKVQGAGSVVGSKLSDAGGQLDVNGTNFYLRLPLAGIRKAAVVYGAEADRAGDLEFVAATAVGVGGALSPKFYLGTVAPA